MIDDDSSIEIFNLKLVSDRKISTKINQTNSFKDKLLIYKKD
jgi:hypothetical protein